jgi:hypothetical protein
VFLTQVVFVGAMGKKEHMNFFRHLRLGCQSYDAMERRRGEGKELGYLIYVCTYI